MNSLKIFLSPFAYYVRLNVEEFEEHQKRGGLQKWVDNRKGMLPYEFIEFHILEEEIDLGFPTKITKIGILGSDALCYHPFDHKTSVSTNVFIPIKTISNNDDEVHFFFAKEQSSKLRNYEKFYTRDGQPFIEKISFHIDSSTSNLREKIEYSDKTYKTSYYHLISKGAHLQKPEWYANFDFD